MAPVSVRGAVATVHWNPRQFDVAGAAEVIVGVTTQTKSRVDVAILDQRENPAVHGAEGVTRGRRRRLSVVSRF